MGLSPLAQQVPCTEATKEPVNLLPSAHPQGTIWEASFLACCSPEGSHRCLESGLLFLLT